jgi:hypothetical protein
MIAKRIKIIPVAKYGFLLFSASGSLSETGGVMTNHIPIENNIPTNIAPKIIVLERESGYIVYLLIN